jgi:hypothetical protein
MCLCLGRVSSVNAGGSCVRGAKQGGLDSNACLGNGPVSERPDLDHVPMGVDVIFHLDVLRLTLSEEFASGTPFDANTRKQLSLDLEDLW